ncbi:MAG: hypothetical protein HRT89_10640 [Lentisphaeria bacterium]|nr:hypothetical protein [Lentisphaeria bacterium]NQZ68513.1 hypothetical protein [Lentisphaeria bacterium]
MAELTPEGKRKEWIITIVIILLIVVFVAYGYMIKMPKDKDYAIPASSE